MQQCFKLPHDGKITKKWMYNFFKNMENEWVLVSGDEILLYSWQH